VSLLDEEIREQPDVLARLLERNREAVAAVVRALERRPPAFVLIASRGSSGNAARYGQHVFGRLNRLPVGFASPSLHTVYESAPLLRSALVIGISQSGQSPDVVSVIEDGRRQGQITVAITNDAASPLAQAAEHMLSLHAGPERAVAATKTYTASLCAVAQLAATLTGSPALRSELDAVPASVERQTFELGDVSAAVEVSSTWQSCAVVGRGPNYSTAFEAALKIKELTAIVAEPYAPADLMHGPIAVVRPDYPVVVVAPSGPARPAMDELLGAIRQRGCVPLIVSDEAGLRKDREGFLRLVPVPEWLSPLVAVIPVQLLAAGVAERRGVDVDRPFGLSKVTLTR
jgi:glucosamine--fructose-6-phosphate aminotransferase (isomerizing)